MCAYTKVLQKHKSTKFNSNHSFSIHHLYILTSKYLTFFQQKYFNEGQIGRYSLYLGEWMDFHDQ